MSGLVHETSVPATCEWYTPAWIFEKLGLRFDVDPCHPVVALAWVPAAKTFNIHDDGLAQFWQGRVWLNPPYGKHTPTWLNKMAEHFQAGEATGIALLFARTDTKWFQTIVGSATAVCFMRRRVRFVDAEGKEGGSPGAGSMLIAWGHAEAAALEAADLGPVWRLPGGLAA